MKFPEKVYGQGAQNYHCDLRNVLASWHSMGQSFL